MQRSWRSDAQLPSFRGWKLGLRLCYGSKAPAVCGRLGCFAFFFRLELLGGETCMLCFDPLEKLQLHSLARYICANGRLIRDLPPLGAHRRERAAPSPPLS